MKTIKRVLSLAVMAAMVILLFNNCSKDDDGNTVISLPSLTATIDGSEYKSLFRQTTRGTVFSDQEGFVILATNTASQSEGEFITIIVRGVEARTYDLSVSIYGGKGECGIYYKESAGDESTQWSALSGSVTITNVDPVKHTVSGTFQFTLNKIGAPDQTKTITNGTFENLIYINADLSTLISKYFSDSGE